MKKGDIYECAQCGANVLGAVVDPGGDGRSRVILLEAEGSLDHLFGFNYALENGRARRVGFGYTGVRFRKHHHPSQRLDGSTDKADA